MNTKFCFNSEKKKSYRNTRNSANCLGKQNSISYSYLWIVWEIRRGRENLKHVPRSSKPSIIRNSRTVAKVCELEAHTVEWNWNWWINGTQTGRGFVTLIVNIRERRASERSVLNPVWRLKRSTSSQLQPDRRDKSTLSQFHSFWWRLSGVSEWVWNQTSGREGTWCLHLQSEKYELQMKAAATSRTVISFSQATLLKIL